MMPRMKEPTMLTRVLSTLRRALLAAALLTAGVAGAHAQVVCNPQDDGYTFSWQNRAWAGTATSVNQWTVNRPTGGDPITISFRFTGSTARFVSGYPAISSLATGGNATGTQSLLPLLDFANTTEQINLAVGFSAPVYNLTFTMYDIDTIAPSLGTGGFRDNAVMLGANSTNGGTNIAPTLTTPYFALPTTNQSPSTVQLFTATSGRVRGITGDSAATSAVGNATAAFAAPINSFNWTYGNSGITSANPAQQAIAIHDFSFCVPRFANVSATKNVVVHRSDPVGCGTFPGTPEAGLPAAIPGACVEYTIRATNTGAGIARGVDLRDVLSANHVYQGAQTSGFITTEPGYAFTRPTAGTSCAGTACTVSLTNARLNPGGVGTIRIRAQVK